MDEKQTELRKALDEAFRRRENSMGSGPVKFIKYKDGAPVEEIVPLASSARVNCWQNNPIGRTSDEYIGAKKRKP